MIKLRVFGLYIDREGWIYNEETSCYEKWEDGRIVKIVEVEWFGDDISFS